MKKSLLAILFLLTVVGTLQAQVLFAPTTGGGGSAGYQGPGNIVSGASAWYGLRGYSAAVAATGTQKAVRLYRVSDATEIDVLILTTGDLDVATAVTFCTATPLACRISHWYDQSGNGRDLIPFNTTTTAFIAFGCLGAHPCMQSSAITTPAFTAASVTVAQPMTIDAVARRTAGVSVLGTILAASTDSSFLGFNSGANGAFANDTGTIIATAADNTVHSLTAVYNGLSSVLCVNGTDTTGILTSSFSSLLQLGAHGTQVDFLQGDMFEAGVWPVGFSSGNRTAISNQKHAYWGF